MRFASVGSGSQGNGCVVAAANTLLLVDCAFSLRNLIQRLAVLGLQPADLTGVLVTHGHADHIRGIGPLVRKYQVPVYMTAGTASSASLGRVAAHHQAIEAGHTYTIGEINVIVHAVPHDAREPVQFVFTHHNKRLGVLTDIGTITNEIVQAYQGLDALMLEANHCPEMLARGPYPASLKQRVGGAWGHLSNQQSVGLLEQLNLQQLQHLVLAHISQKNNCPRRVTEVFAHLTEVAHVLRLASQEHGFDWLQIA